ncbi:hypothetical protein AKJ65_03195 [candidate division MSBL1 archaeon SCGC-AAA259E19]|uniref:HTH hxlR-type domain-containing protein n=1 Tax=candidate division MSBL1 archaeon SCGC-AAA259E19 TaxID=1698264 RepID=A0A133UKY6_9EURY|nr:hypothetical protein AKJ65_03195 [candidate division MSBL1 archaeon SCGC-AAA259E19]
MVHMKISDLLESPCVKILSFLHEGGEVRFYELTDLISSRGTLSDNLGDLEEEGLIRRRIVESKPIKSFYSLSEKGDEVAKHLSKVKDSF